MSVFYIKIQGVKGVGKVELELQDAQRVYTLLGINGIGKTKILESLFQSLFFSHASLFKKEIILKNSANFVFRNLTFNDKLTFCAPKKDNEAWSLDTNITGIRRAHNTPVVFLASQNRGFIEHKELLNHPIGVLKERRNHYLEKIMDSMNKNFTSLNMDTDIEDWFVKLAQSSNPYQKQEDNREVELKTVLKLLHEIDKRIDPSYMKISGDGRVQLKIEDHERELSHLSTGFASILKILQAIISGYGYFTNETQLQNVNGIVLIDEIESHLHLSWQAKIIPLLKNLFPKTLFYITTHSSIVLSQLKEGEAYRLQRDEQDDIVRSYPIITPSKASLIDVLKDAFNIDLNRLKLDGVSPDEQKNAKQQLLKLLKEKNNA